MKQQKGLLDRIDAMQKRDGIEAVIFGCTELPLALHDNNCPLPCLDTMQLHIEKLTEIMVKENGADKP